MEDKLTSVIERYHALEEEMANPEIVSDQKRFREVNREHSQLAPIVQLYREYVGLKKELEDNQELLESEEESEMREMLQSDIDSLEEKIPEVEDKLMVLLLPKDPNSGKDIIMEIRAGTGGDEAALFVADLFRMYSRYIDISGLKMEIIEAAPTEIGGYKEVLFAVKGSDAHDNLKFESGVHRVQRVPSTESGGRIHTSAVTVAVMPEAEETDIEIPENDLRVDVYRSSGHGGQSVNTTDSAVRLTHIPTGIVVVCQDEKSQHKNKAKALRVLRARLLEKEMQERMAREAEMRKMQVGSGDRSERIRTYNFPQSRVTDHRINLTLYSLESILNGELQEIIDALQRYQVDQQLKVVNNGA